MVFKEMNFKRLQQHTVKDTVRHERSQMIKRYSRTIYLVPIKFVSTE